jgi:hypothetical protein
VSFHQRCDLIAQGFIARTNFCQESGSFGRFSLEDGAQHLFNLLPAFGGHF